MVLESSSPSNGRPVMTCEEFTSSVQRWLGSEIECRSTIDDGLIATLPLLKPDGDFIEVGLEPLTGGRWRICDLGETHATLFLAGVTLADPYSRTGEFEEIKRAFGISEDGDRLYVDTGDSESLVESIFSFVHGVQSALALQFTIKFSSPSRDFTAVVNNFLAKHQTSYTIPTESISGKSGSWKFQFILNHGRPETLIKTVTAGSRSKAMALAKQTVFEIRDVIEVRPSSDVVVITDDEGEREGHWGSKQMNVFDAYGVKVYPFIRRQNDLLELASRYPV